MDKIYNQFEDNLGKLIDVLKLANESSDDGQKQQALNTADFLFEKVKEDISGVKTFIPTKTNPINESRLDNVIKNYKRLF